MCSFYSCWFYLVLKRKKKKSSKKKSLKQLYVIFFFLLCEKTDCFMAATNGRNFMAAYVQLFTVIMTEIYFQQ